LLSLFFSAGALNAILSSTNTRTGTLLDVETLVLEEMHHGRVSHKYFAR